MIEFSVTDGVATIMLNKPEKLNAIGAEMWAQLDTAITECASNDDIRAVILTGAGRAFCAGADISGGGGNIDGKPRKTGIIGAMDAMAGYNSIIKKLYHLNKPVIAAVHGAAIGIAWSMILCCDWVLVTEAAKFRPAFLNLAKVPEGGIMFLMEKLIGRMKARDIIYRAKFVSGQEAVDIGLATELVPEAELQDKARALARELAGGPPAVLTMTKRLFNSNATSFEQFLDMELNAISIAVSMDDAVEGMKAFREKRPPQFTGR